MPSKGLFINIPMRVRVDYLDLVGDITVPPIEIPIVVPPQPTPIPPTPVPPIVAPPPVTGPDNFQVIQIANRLPWERRNTDARGTAYKDSLTFHWEGPDAIPMGDNETTIQQLVGVAVSHIARDWGNGQRGSGIMYHECIAPSGDSLIMRDYEEIAWHCNDDSGNLHSRAILVWCSRANPALPAQLRAVRKRIADFTGSVGHAIPRYPHSKWSPTECPGDVIRAILG